ncbi:hypothetical protein M3596_21575 [Bacillus subtilis]|uniref:hypothetical protein n=1 Tax=Bacillus subtilis TaxID=1423 RepID=UPI00203D41B3|nr:hypothetical protein [Bacillus subtilis]MCM3191308.1 hypothetical protein [Bacillus subtilis]
MIIVGYYVLLFGVTILFFYSLGNLFLTLWPIKSRGKVIMETDKLSEFELEDRVEQANLILRAFIALVFGLVVSPLFFLVKGCTEDVMSNSSPVINSIGMVVTGIGLLKAKIIFILLLIGFILSILEHIVFRIKFKIKTALYIETERRELQAAQKEYEQKYKDHIKRH